MAASTLRTRDDAHPVNVERRTPRWDAPLVLPPIPQPKECREPYPELCDKATDMSIEAMVWVLYNCERSGTDKVVMLGLANHADPEGENAWPSVARLARYANVSERAVQQSLARLLADGALLVERQKGGQHDTPADRRTNRYCIVGVKSTSPRALDGVKPASPRGEAERGDGVKPASPEPSLRTVPEPSEHVDVLTLVDDAHESSGFERLWESYPKRNGKRVGRKQAEQQWAKLTSQQRLAARRGAVHYANACERGLTIAKDAHRWLRDHDFDDWQEPAVDDRRRGAGPTPGRRVSNDSWAQGGGFG